MNPILHEHLYPERIRNTKTSIQYTILTKMLNQPLVGDDQLKHMPSNRFESSTRSMDV
jgi:hypothetical protein